MLRDRHSFFSYLDLTQKINLVRRKKYSDLIFILTMT